ncbi:MAG: hypothetical protein PHU34_06795 [Candidatus Methanoperedens sp.]|nr:hypothetical protein [Candidatus Methanoperedens sp.]
MNDNLTKAKINLNEGTIELEGAEGFVQKNLDVFKDFISQPIKTSSKEVEANDAEIKQSNDFKTKQSNNGIKKYKPSRLDNVSPEEFDISCDGVIPFKDFFNDKKPSRTAPEMIAVTGFYLKHYLKKEEFSEGNVMYAYVAVGVKRPVRVHKAFQDTKDRLHWVTKGSSVGKWILSQIGEDYVLHDLPNTKK